MEKGDISHRLQTVAWMMFGVVIGYILFDQSRELGRLKRENEELKSKAITGNSKLTSKFVTVKRAALLPSVRESSKPPTNEVAQQDVAQLDRLGVLHNRRRSLEDNVRERSISKLSESRREEYQKLFGELGMSQAQIETFREALKDIHRQSSIVELGMQHLYDARVSYEEELRKSMSPENFDKYREYELSRTAVSEVGKLERYLKEKSNATLDEATERALVLSIRDAKAVPLSNWIGPFDPIPSPTQGHQAVMNFYEDLITRVSQTAPDAVNRAAQAGVPEMTLQLVREYYDNLVRSYQRELDIMRAGQNNNDAAAAKSRERLEQIKAARTRR